MPNELAAIRPVILSLVRDPANRRLFYVKKENRDMADDFKVTFPVEDEIETVFKEAEEKAEVSDKAKEAIKSALQMLSKWAAELPSDVKKAVSVLARAAGYGESYGLPKQDPQNPVEVKLDDSAMTDQLIPIRKALSALLTNDAAKESLPTLEEAIDSYLSRKPEEDEPEEDEPEGDDPDDNSGDELSDAQKKAIVESVTSAIKETIEEGSKD